MRGLAAVLLVGCGFHPTAAVPTVDAAEADAPLPTLCGDPHALLCYSFDEDPLPAALPDDGAVAVDAQLTSVGSIPMSIGNAALLDTASEIFVPMASGVTGVESVEVWFRLDAEPPDGGRAGLYDSNVGPDNMSLFINRNGTAHTLRGGLGNETTTWAATITTAHWYYAACICTGTNEQMWLDGVLIGDTPGPCSNGGTIVTDGLTIGANNNGGPTGVNDHFVGAIDAIRLSTQAPSAAQICATAGLSGC